MKIAGSVAVGIAGLVSLCATGPAGAALLDARTIVIGSQLDTMTSPLQVAEVVARETGTGTDVALGATATATSEFQFGGGEAFHAVDGDTGGSFLGNGIYHNNSATDPAAKLTVTLSQGYSLDSLSIYGRTDCCSDRDLYTLSIFNSAGNELYSARLDARQTHVATVTFSDAVPEPTSWAMMMVGFGILGGAMRQHRRAACTPT